MRWFVGRVCLVVVALLPLVAMPACGAGDGPGTVTASIASRVQPPPIEEGLDLLTSRTVGGDLLVVVTAGTNEHEFAAELTPKMELVVGAVLRGTGVELMGGRTVCLRLALPFGVAPQAIVVRTAHSGIADLVQKEMGKLRPADCQRVTVMARR
jgi:hypothetical protein